MADGMTATVVVAVESASMTNSIPIIHITEVDIGGLEEVYAGALTSAITVFGNLLHVVNAGDQEGLLGRSLSRKRVDACGLIGVRPVIKIHMIAFLVEHRISIGIGLTFQVLEPGHVVGRLVVQCPCQRAVGHAVVVDARLTVRCILITIS